VLRRLLLACDRFYRWFYGLLGPEAEVGPILRVRLARYRGRPFTLGDGTAVGAGDLIGEFHLSNERAAGLHGGGGPPGLAFRRAFEASLVALAERAATAPAYRDVRAFTSVTIFHTGTQREGFEIHPLPHPLWGRLVGAYERALMAHFHPHGRPQRRRRGRFAEARRIWISRGELLRRFYAPARSSPSGTHA
jgi:hypothetical protein